MRELLDTSISVNSCDDIRCDCRCEWTYGVEEMLEILSDVVEFVGKEDNPMESIPYNSALYHVREILTRKR